MKTILVDAVDCFVSDTGDIFQEMHELLETYPNPKILLTGADDTQYSQFGLDKMPYEVFTLKHNPEKTDPRYYQTLLATHGLALNAVVYFEHNPKAVESARSVGITTYWYDHTKRDIAALKQFLAEAIG